ncbi:hypothetical protein [Streptomyces sp900105755]|uniref:Uncharacterized protein n=1 Tax=Streptomyces sp. 900105755 TaxID=3154389 RepID=A0ABV1TA42_9ACTN
MGEKQEGKPVPRDLPDQQAGSGQDPWEAADSARPEDRGDGDRPEPDLPDPDEAGAGPDGTPRSGSVHPESPVPDEPSA